MSDLWVEESVTPVVSASQSLFYGCAADSGSDGVNSP